MTPKELEYCEDCLSIEMQLQTKCNDYSQKIQDQQLKDFVTNLAASHKKHFQDVFTSMKSN